MKLLFKQRLFSWFDSYDIYDEKGTAVYEVKGQLSWGHCLKIFDQYHNEVGTVQEKVLTWLPKFEMYLGETYIGCISKEFTFLKPRFHIDCKDWKMEGDFLEWDYKITDSSGGRVAAVSKEIWNWTDTYVIDVADERDRLCVLVLVLAIDAEKCSRN